MPSAPAFEIDPSATFEFTFATDVPGGPMIRFRFTVTVNEMVPQRERRSGQLALAGGGWVWLRGDRESPAQAVEAEIA